MVLAYIKPVSGFAMFRNKMLKAYSWRIRHHEQNYREYESRSSFLLA